MLALSLLIWAHTGNAPVSLSHIFQKGETSAFFVDSTLRTEGRDRGIATWFPDSTEFKYQYSVTVLDVVGQGVAKLRYKRPTMTRIDAEQFDRPERTVVEKVNDNVLIDLSSANEILDSKDAKFLLPMPVNTRARFGGKTLGTGPENFIKTLYSLALFTGSLESSIEFNPRLPFDKVKPGDNWKRTASYAPQKVKGGGGMAVQRLDYTYTYVGQIQSEGKTVDRVVAKLHLETDVAVYIHQSQNLTPADTHLRALPVLLDATMEFDLNPTTHKTIRATASSKGSFQIFATDFSDGPVYEEKLSGETTMEPLASNGKAKN